MNNRIEELEATIALAIHELENRGGTYALQVLRGQIDQEGNDEIRKAEKMTDKIDTLPEAVERLANNLESEVRFNDTARNVILNTALIDLEKIINNHDPEVDTSINNGVWGRLDKMALEIENLCNEALSARVAELEQKKNTQISVISQVAEEWKTRAEAAEAIRALPDPTDEQMDAIRKGGE